MQTCFNGLKIFRSTSGAVKSEIMSNQDLAEELPKPIIRKFEKRKLHSSFIDNIWGAYRYLIVLQICN